MARLAPGAAGLAVLALALSGCRPNELPARRYACDPKGSRQVGSDQCPGDFRCGLEGTCHPVGNVDVRWLCVDATDCESGWQCGVGDDGVTRECHDPAEAFAFRCLTSADCSAGWSCGFDDDRRRQCHDPAAPDDWPCDTHQDCVAGWQCGLADLGGRECHDPRTPQAWKCQTNADCLGGWQCGLNDERTGRQCHDPAAPDTYACVVQSDCVAGWQCGLTDNRLQRECHDPSAPGPFACADDGDCVGGWRCGLDLRCVDPSRDALRTPPAVALDGGVQINPSVTAEVTRLAISPKFFTSAGHDERTLFLERTGQLEALVARPDGTYRTHALGPTPPGTLALSAPGPRSYRDDPGLGQYVRTEDHYVWMSLADAGIVGFQLLPDGGSRFQVADVYYRAGLPAVPLTRLKHGMTNSPTEVPYQIGFSSAVDSYLVFDGPDTARGRELPTGTLVSPLLDADDLFLTGVDRECIFFVDRGGLWVNQANYPDVVEPVTSQQFGHRACGATGLRVERFDLVRFDRAVVKAEAWDGGRPQLAVWDLSPMLVDRGADSYCSSTSGRACNERIPYNVVLGPCSACPSGDLIDYAAVDGPGTNPAVELEVRCSRGDAGAFILYRHSLAAGGGTSCDSRAVVASSSFFQQTAAVPASSVGQGRVAYFARGGRVWFGADMSGIASLSFDRVPHGVVRTGVLPSEIVVVAENVLGSPSASLGLASFPSRSDVVPGSNEPFWAISQGQLRLLRGASSIFTGRTLAVLTSTPATPRTLVKAIDRTGATLAVLASGNQLLAAEVDEAPGSAALGLFELKVATVNPIRSLALVRGGADAGTLLEGYLVNGPSVSHLTVASSARWVLEDVPLPLTLSPKEVWFDGPRGRVGFSNGSIVSLPSRVSIAAPLPAGAEDFEQLCQQDFALTNSGLYRLTLSPPLVVGRWEPVPLPAGYAPNGFSGGRLFAVPPSLYLFTAAGEAAVLPLDGCP